MIFWPFKLALRIVSALSMLVILYFAITFVQIWLTGHEHSKESAQAILVFAPPRTTAAVGGAHGAPPSRAHSLQAGTRTVDRRHRRERPGDDYTEAGVSATYLEDHGVPAKRILKGAGNDTWQNVTTVMPLLKKHHIVTVLTVTDPFHEYRAMAISSAQGLAPQPSPVSDSPTIHFSCGSTTSRRRWR